MTRKEEIEKGLTYFENNKDRLTALYKEMYGAVSCPSWTCPGSVSYAYEKMFRDRNKEITSFRMKRGAVINTIMRNEENIPKGHFTCHNMTDEIARILIDNGYSSYFIL